MKEIEAQRELLNTLVKQVEKRIKEVQQETKNAYVSRTATIYKCFDYEQP
jgi:hypothetical protein